ncbi:tail tube [Aeromonas phage GomatiRiver_11]|nr:baseplate tail-tube junction protein [Aeromonas phage AhFM11]WKW84169.1 tail tube [Aeromonas phage GomatiRiver_11]
MYRLDEFQAELGKDFQRNNMFSVVFATTPSSKTTELLDGFGSFLYNNLPVGKDFAGLTQGNITNALNKVIVQGTQSLIRKSGVSRYLIGAMTSRTIQSLLGQFEVGTYLLDFFNMGNTHTGLTVFSVKLPENRLNYEMDKYHNAPNIKIQGREYEPLVISFRMDHQAQNYRAMQDWVNAVEDPVTGLRSLPADVEADIQVNLHARNGIPHTVVMFQGCIPVGVSAPQLSYDENSSITTFDVTFAYRVMYTGAVNQAMVDDWLKGDLLPELGKQAGGWLSKFGPF